MKKIPFIFFVAVILAIGAIYIYPKTKYVFNPEFRGCLKDKKDHYFFILAAAKKDLKLCEKFKEEDWKMFCKAKITKDASICEEFENQEDKIECLAAAGDSKFCEKDDAYCFALAENSSLCLEDEACFALANLNFSYFKNRFKICSIELKKSESLLKAYERCVYNYSLTLKEVEECLKAI